MPSSISVADFDADGFRDIFLVTERGVIYRFREDGTRLWVIDMKGRTIAPGAIIDVDDDGQLEYLLCTQSGRLLIFGQRSELLLDRQFEHRTINSTPTFGNLNLDSPGLEMVITGGEAGKVLCFSIGAPTDVVGSWPSYRRDPGMSGMALKEEGWDLKKERPPGTGRGRASPGISQSHPSGRRGRVMKPSLQKGAEGIPRRPCGPHEITWVRP